MSAGAYPRVLIINIDPVLRKGSQGITLTNLFSGWEPRSLGQMFFKDTEADPAICRNNHRLPPSSIPADHVLRRFLSGAVRVDHPLTQKISAVGPAADCRPGLRVRLHLALRALSDLGPVRLPHQTVKWIRDFHPDVIYTCLGNVRVTRLTTAVSRVAGNVPVVPHFMDDWPSTLYADGRLGGIPQEMLGRQLRGLFRRVPLGFCIGSHMAAEYELRYGLEFHGFMNCVDDTDFPVLGQTRTHPPLVWTYVGGLHLNRSKSLLMLARAITSRGDMLNVFAPASDVREHGLNFTSLPGAHVGSLAPEDVMASMKESDVLLHVESFEPAESAFTRLSVSTKLAQYFSCGKAVLGFGPGDLASMKIVEETGAGLVVAVESQAAVDAAVKRIAGDPSFRAACGERSLAFASVHFRKSRVCEHFRERLAQAARAGASRALLAGSR